MPNTDMPSGGSRAPAPPSIDDSASSSFSNIDSEHLKVEASENTQKASEQTSETADRAKEKSSDYAQTAKENASSAASYSKKKSHEFADSSEKGYEKAKKSAASNAKEAKKEVKSAGQDLNENRDNPVVIANMALLVAGSAALGYAAYTKHAAGELNWQIVGIAAAAVGALAAGDYYVSQ